jgi:hypothetical protein
MTNYCSRPQVSRLASNIAELSRRNNYIFS